jgi:hypothetical protein
LRTVFDRIAALLYHRRGLCNGGRVRVVAALHRFSRCHANGSFRGRAVLGSLSRRAVECAYRPWNVVI